MFLLFKSNLTIKTSKQHFPEMFKDTLLFKVSLFDGVYIYEYMYIYTSNIWAPNPKT